MILIRREGFVSALRKGIVWYLSQDEHGEDAATKLAVRFSVAVDLAIAEIAQRPDAGAIWPHRRDYRFRALRKPFQRWLIFYRQPAEDVVELVELIAGERDLPRRLAKT